jgi:polyhydroxybutyrate depolymerase
VVVGAAVLLGCGLVLAAQPAAACPGLDPCEVADGRYYALPPPGWDGESPLAATIFFHGWQSTGLAFAENPEFTAAFAAEGVMLVLPDGVNKTWAHAGSPSRARDELAFMDDVRADLLARWPVDADRLLVTGFSQGGSMAWDLACHRGRDYRAFTAVSGAFWEPLPERCKGGAVDLLHVHGTDDGVVPMAGRPIGDQWRQGDVLAGMAILRDADGCPAAPARAGTTATGLDCRIWDRCSSGRELRLCRHGGGHLMPEGWVGLAHAWARALPAAEEGG